jgi:hypothetical protein
VRAGRRCRSCLLSRLAYNREGDNHLEQEHDYIFNFAYGS